MDVWACGHLDFHNEKCAVPTKCQLFEEHFDPGYNDQIYY